MVGARTLYSRKDPDEMCQAVYEPSTPSQLI